MMGFNRTRVELKRDEWDVVMTWYNGFNRTRVELKREIHIFQRSPDRDLIAPEWN